jgi:hypothetical protein
LASIFNDDSPGDGRSQTDRRLRPTSPLDAFRWGGRRARLRRGHEIRGAFFVDRFDTVTLAMVLSLLSLTILDGVLTLELLDMNGEEANPLMGYLLNRGPLAFLLGKYILTAIGLPFLVVYKNYPMFGTRFRAGFLLPVFIGLYVTLISYQWVLFHVYPAHAPTARAGHGLAADSRSGEPIQSACCSGVASEGRTRRSPGLSWFDSGSRSWFSSMISPARRESPRRSRAMLLIVSKRWTTWSRGARRRAVGPERGLDPDTAPKPST